MRSAGKCMVEYDDLMQEARLSFLEHIRRIDDKRQICACRSSIIHVLYDQCMLRAPVHIAEHRFKNEIKSVKTASFEEVDERECVVNDFEEDMDRKIMMECFLNSLSKSDRRILELKQSGFKGQEIARAMGYQSETYVSRRFSNIKKAYYQHFDNKGAGYGYV